MRAFLDPCQAGDGSVLYCHNTGTFTDPTLAAPEALIVAPEEGGQRGRYAKV
jgi:hypothetical protein